MKSFLIFLSFCGFLYPASNQVIEWPYEPFIANKGLSKYHFPIDEIDELDDYGEKKLKYSIPMVKSTYFCPADNSILIDEMAKVNDKQFAYQDYCLFETNFSVAQQRFCQREVIPVIEPLNKDCGAEEKGRLYAFVAMICKIPNSVKQVKDIVEEEEKQKEKEKNNKTRGETKDQYRAEQSHDQKKAKKNEIHKITPLYELLNPNRKTILYKFCFDHEKKQVIHTWHKIRSPIFWRSSKLLRYSIFRSSLSTEGFGYFGDTFERMAKEKEEHEKNGYEQNKMIHPSHMVFGILKKAVYHYANVRYTPPETSKFWDETGIHIMELAMTRNEEYQIFTGDINRSENTAIWWQVVFYEKDKSATTIVLQNHDEKLFSCNEDAEIERTTYSESFALCKTIKSLTPPKKTAYCCITENDHLKLFHIKLPFSVDGKKAVVLDEIPSQIGLYD